MAPIQLGKWVVLFCDGINLPDYDKYGEYKIFVGLHLPRLFFCFTIRTGVC